jgi:hypothetical protein
MLRLQVAHRANGSYAARGMCASFTRETILFSSDPGMATGGPSHHPDAL